MGVKATGSFGTKVLIYSLTALLFAGPQWQVYASSTNCHDKLREQARSYATEIEQGLFQTYEATSLDGVHAKKTLASATGRTKAIAAEAQETSQQLLRGLDPNCRTRECRKKVLDTAKIKITAIRKALWASFQIEREEHRALQQELRDLAHELVSREWTEEGLSQREMTRLVQEQLSEKYKGPKGLHRKVARAITDMLVQFKKAGAALKPGPNFMMMIRQNTDVKNKFWRDIRVILFYQFLLNGVLKAISPETHNFTRNLWVPGSTFGIVAIQNELMARETGGLMERPAKEQEKWTTIYDAIAGIPELLHSEEKTYQYEGLSRFRAFVTVLPFEFAVALFFKALVEVWTSGQGLAILASSKFFGIVAVSAIFVSTFPLYVGLVEAYLMTPLFWRLLPRLERTKAVTNFERIFRGFRFAADAAIAMGLSNFLDHRITKQGSSPSSGH